MAASAGAQPGRARARASRLLVAAGLVALTAAAFAPVLDNGFVDYDDDLYITENPRVRAGLTPGGVAWAFGTFHGANWFPLTWLSWMLDAELFGVEAWAFHLTSLLLHCASAALLFAVLARSTGATWPSAVVAAVFAVHPLHVESVAWASYRRDVLSGLFFVLALGAHVRLARRGASPARRLALLACAALGLMAKPTLVTLPLVLLLLDAWPLGRLGGAAPVLRLEAVRVRSAVVEKLPLVALAAASSAVTFAAQQSWGAVQSLEHVPLGARVANALVSTAAYLGVAFWPAKLAVFYPHPGTGLPLWQPAAAAALIAVVTALCAAQARRRPYLAVGWLWFLVTLVPVIGLVQVGAQARADRYTYLPLIGLSIAVVWGVRDWVAPRRAARRAAAALALAVVAALALATSAQVRRWRDSFTLFEHALRVTRNNHVAHVNLAEALIDEGRLSDAMAHAVTALRLAPRSAFAHGAMGQIMAGSGRHRVAVHHYRAALRGRPESSVWLAGLGRAHYGLGELDEAVAAYESAIELDPGRAELHANLGLARYAQGRLEAAIAHYRRALALDPQQVEARGNLGVALLESGEPGAAVEHLERALAQRPELAVLHAHLGRALAERGEVDRAIPRLRRAARLEPDNAAVRALLGSLLDGAGRDAEAVAAYRAALRRGLRDPTLLNNLAWLIATSADGALGSPDEAVALATEAVAASGRRDPTFLDTLAESQAAAGRPEAAARTAREALALAESTGRRDLAADLREKLSRWK